MATIYSNASQVVAWLEEDPRASMKIAPILELARMAVDIEFESPGSDNRTTLLKWVYGDSERVGWLMSVMGTMKDAGFPSFYQSSWFTRMWIVQEALLAKKLVLHFGAAHLDWDDFEKVMILLHAVNAATRYPMVGRESFLKYSWALIEVRDHWVKSRSHPIHPSHITYYMHQLRRKGCKDDRDRVFALRGLISENTELDIRPDYSKTFQQIYTEFAIARLRLGNIGVLYDAGLWKRKPYPSFESRDDIISQVSQTDYLPTWVPDYRSDKSFKELAEMRFGSYFGEDSTVPAKLNFDTSREAYRLITQATLIDIVAFVQPDRFIHDEKLRANDALMFLACRRFCMDLRRIVESYYVGRQYPTHEDPKTVFAKALVGGGTDEAYLATFYTKATEALLDPLSL
ncbi:MAG: hypothetical protein Q9221_006712 [Calogaya cf. arnoldii]